MKKRLTMVMAVVCCLSLLVGSLAYFTDKETKSATATAGNIDLEFVDASAFAEHKMTNQTNGYTDGKVWTDSKLVKDGDIMNPGDQFDMGYTLKNEGSKSMDVRQKITVTVTKGGSAQALTEADLQYFMTSDAGNFKLDATETDYDAGKLVYVMDDIILSGSIEEDGDATSKDFDTYLTFAGSALNQFMDSSVNVELVVEAKQHRNTEAGWTVIDSFETGNYVTP